MADGMRARLQLIHPDGRVVLEGPAEVRVTHDRVDVHPERGVALLISVLTIREADVVADAVPLVLDSDYTVRLSELAAPDELLHTVVAARQEALSNALTLPGRQRVLMAEGSMSWRERGWAAMHDRGRLLIDDTHLIFIPDRHPPHSVPLWTISVVKSLEGGGLRLASSVDGLAVEILASDSLNELAQAALGGAQATADRIRAMLPAGTDEELAQALLAGPCVREGSPEARGANLRSLARSLATGFRERAVGLLASLSKEGGLGVGVTVTADGGSPRAVAWALASCASRRPGGGLAIAMPLSEEGECTIAFGGSSESEQPEGAGEGASHCSVARACADVAPHFEPLGLPESELSEACGGRWLWPMHQFPHLREARRRTRVLIPHAHPDEWSRELLRLVASS